MMDAMEPVTIYSMPPSSRGRIKISTRLRSSIKKEILERFLELAFRPVGMQHPQTGLLELPSRFVKGLGHCQFLGGSHFANDLNLRGKIPMVVVGRRRRHDPTFT